MKISKYDVYYLKKIITTHFIKCQQVISNFVFCFQPFFHLFFLQICIFFFMPAIFITVERMASSVTPSKQILQNSGTYVFIVINKNYILKFIYSAKSSPYFWPQYRQSQVRGRFCKILWPSQNLWTLCSSNTGCFILKCKQ